MTRYQSTRRDRHAALGASLLLAAAVIVAVVVLATKLAHSVQHQLDQVPAQDQHSLAAPNLHGMWAAASALAASPLVWGLALCLLGATWMTAVRRRG